ncbi:MAG: quinone-dependent dihydroorotate dehydrogenase [Patescibacteria group bacterium]
MNFYQKIVKPILFLFSPDLAHRLAGFGLRTVNRLPPAKWLTRRLFNFEHPKLEKIICGLRFKNPIGLAAGFDPNGRQAAMYSTMGFGWSEIGSVTNAPQAGNPPPHAARLIEDNSLIVHKGLKNLGVRAVVEHLKRLKTAGQIDYPLGLSIARTTDIAEADTARDYLASFRAAAEVADYVTINVSCPNVACFTPEKQLLHVAEILRLIDVERIEQKIKMPIWIKFGPDLGEADNERLIELCLRYHVDAIVLTNLVKDRRKLVFQSRNTALAGGVSGKLLAPYSLATLKFFAKRLNGQIPLVSVGGVFNAQDALERFRAGASLVQLITAWIFEGPGLLKKINRELVETGSPML